MKGLLYKEFLMVVKHCKAFFFLGAVFAVGLALEPGNLFYMVYPCLFAGMIPMSLLSYDERDKWTRFSSTLPVSRGMLVSVKYLVGMLCQLAVLAAIGIVYCVSLWNEGMFVAEEFLATLAILLSFDLIVPAPLMPCIFKLGAEKGRMVYYVILGVVSGLAAAGAYFGYDFALLPQWGVGGLCCLCAALYAASWLLSIRFYQNQDL